MPMSTPHVSIPFEADPEDLVMLDEAVRHFRADYDRLGSRAYWLAESRDGAAGDRLRAIYAEMADALRRERDALIELNRELHRLGAVPGDLVPAGRSLYRAGRDVAAATRVEAIIPADGPDDGPGDRDELAERMREYAEMTRYQG